LIKHRCAIGLTGIIQTTQTTMKKLNTLPILYTGQQFRVVRKEAGLSLNHLHKMSGVSRTQIIRFENEIRDENGKIYSPVISTYRKLIEALAKFQSEKEAQP